MAAAVIGERVFRAILPEQIAWMPFPAFPPSARLAVVVGDPAKPGPYVVRVKVPGGVTLMPHRHPEDRQSGEYVTQVSGTGPLGLEYRHPHDDPRLHPSV